MEQGGFAGFQELYITGWIAECRSGSIWLLRMMEDPENFHRWVEQIDAYILVGKNGFTLRAVLANLVPMVHVVQF